MKTRILVLLLALLASPVAVSRFSAFRVQAQVTSGSISPVSFPSDFPTARESLNPMPGYPYNIIASSSSSTPFLLEGQAAPVNVGFQSNYNYSGSSTGAVTLTASSDAFVSEVSSTMDINQTYTAFTFTLTPTIKPGIDGSYLVYYRAVNELSVQVDARSDSITVWSDVHEGAADSLYTASVLMSTFSYPADIYGSRYQSAEAKANVTLATIEYALATLAYNNKDWNNTETHALNATDLIHEADSAEAASNLQDKTAYLVQLGTYPLLIIAALIMVYIVVATFRKVYPSTKTAKPA